MGRRFVLSISSLLRARWRRSLRAVRTLQRVSHTQGRSQTFIPGGGPSGRQGGQAKFSKYFSLVENHLKLVLKF